MDEHEQVEPQVEDLEVDAENAEQVKGGGGLPMEEVSFNYAKAASPQLGKQRGGIESQHNETLVVI